MATLGDKPSLERIGFFLESLKEDMEEVKRTLEDQNEMYREKYDQLEKAHEDLKNEVQNFKIRGDTTVRIFKWIVSLLIAIITFKLGDVKTLFGLLPGK